MRLAKYTEMVRLDLIQRATYIYNELYSVLTVGVVLFIFLHLWTVIYGPRAVIEGFTLTQMIWYLAFAETLMFSQGAQFIDKIGREVRDGQIGLSLLKPYSYLGRLGAELASFFLFKFVSIGVIALGIANGLVGPIPLDLKVLPLILLVALLSGLLNFFIVTGLGLLAFFIDDVRALWWIYQKLVFVLGGMLVPLDVYPGWIQPWLRHLPTSYLMYYPSKLFVHFDWALFWQTLAGIGAYLLIFGALTLIIYRKGLRRIDIHGG